MEQQSGCTASQMLVCAAYPFSLIDPRFDQKCCLEFNYIHYELAPRQHRILQRFSLNYQFTASRRAVVAIPP